MDMQHLAIASIPMQPWGQLYDAPTALKKGTVFQDLDMLFCGGRRRKSRVLLRDIRYDGSGAKGKRRADA